MEGEQIAKQETRFAMKINMRAIEKETKCVESMATEIVIS